MSFDDLSPELFARMLHYLHGDKDAHWAMVASAERAGEVSAALTALGYVTSVEGPCQGRFRVYFRFAAVSEEFGT